MSGLGQRIREARKHLGMTQAQLAEPDLTKGFISLVETGRARPSLKSLEQIARRLGKPVSYFLEDGAPVTSRDLTLLLRQGEVYLCQRAWSDAARTFQAGLESSGDASPVDRARLHLGVGEALFHQGQARQAQQQFTDALTDAREGRAAEETARALRDLGALEVQRGHVPQAIEHLRSAMRALEGGRSEVRHLHASILAALGEAYGRAGQQDEALASLRQALELLEVASDLGALGRLYAEAGLAARERDERERALGALQRGLDLYEVQEDLRTLAAVQRDLAVILLDRGRPDEASPHLYGSLKIRERLGDSRSQAATMVEIARAHLARRDAARAESYANEAMALLRRDEEPAVHARTQAVLGLIRRQQGKAREAIALLERAARQFARLRMPIELAGVYHELGRIHADRGDQARAAGAYRRALDALRSADSLGGLARFSSLA